MESDGAYNLQMSLIRYILVYAKRGIVYKKERSGIREFLLKLWDPVHRRKNPSRVDGGTVKYANNFA